MNGQFVISLDFEKFWGVFDSAASNGGYMENLENVDIVIDRLLQLSNTYQIKLTFSTVGLLFNKNKEEFISNIPSSCPSYKLDKHNPYPLINSINKSEEEEKKYFGYRALQKIADHDQHEIGTHTYSHYYCLEEGQTLEQFNADLKMAIKVAENFGIDLQSIVFPRNQVNPAYLISCYNHGIKSYRGYENHSIYKPNAKEKTTNPLLRILRLADAYINVTGRHTYKLEELKSNTIINLPSSRFFRPYSKTLKTLEPLKVLRITKAMKKAAIKGELFHLWWHPHNFGKHIDENFYNLEKVFKTFQQLSKDYDFTSSTMTDLAKKLNL